MSHHIYKTDTFILESAPQGEANKIYYLFTRDLGFIVASAQSVRDIKSKLRFSLADLSYSELALVRGKQFWKITSAREADHAFPAIRGDSQKFRMVARVFSLLRRLLHGEEKNSELFEVLVSCFTFLCSVELTAGEISQCECVLVLTVLRLLGYVGARTDFEPFISPKEWNKGLLVEAEKFRAEILKEINRSLSESHL